MTPAEHSQYDALIIEARKGNTEPALSWFSGHHRLDESQVADWMQIALWAGKDNEVINVYSQYKHHTLPARALFSAGDSLSQQAGKSDLTGE
ncbi:hypothetical protein [Enterobacter ludwigii]|uniref:hypothetical protein n=1 Tax=Enterobacter ludwigii TaxID=299767 RepID=UPI003EFB0DF1